MSAESAASESARFTLTPRHVGHRHGAFTRSLSNALDYVDLSMLTQTPATTALRAAAMRTETNAAQQLRSAGFVVERKSKLAAPKLDTVYSAQDVLPDAADAESSLSRVSRTSQVRLTKSDPLTARPLTAHHSPPRRLSEANALRGRPSLPVVSDGRAPIPVIPVTSRRKSHPKTPPAPLISRRRRGASFTIPAEFLRSHSESDAASTPSPAKAAAVALRRSISSPAKSPLVPALSPAEAALTGYPLPGRLHIELHKPEVATVLGVSFDPRGDTPGAIGVRVCAVADGGLAAANRIAVGMTLLSVRGGDGGDEARPVRTAKEAAARLREAAGTLTLELLPARSGASWRGLLK